MSNEGAYGTCHILRNKEAFLTLLPAKRHDPFFTWIWWRMCWQTARLVLQIDYSLFSTLRLVTSFHAAALALSIPCKRTAAVNYDLWNQLCNAWRNDISPPGSRVSPLPRRVFGAKFCYVQLYYEHEWTHLLTCMFDRLFWRYPYNRWTWDPANQW